MAELRGLIEGDAVVAAFSSSNVLQALLLLRYVVYDEASCAPKCCCSSSRGSKDDAGCPALSLLSEDQRCQTRGAPLPRLQVEVETDKAAKVAHNSPLLTHRTFSFSAVLVTLSCAATVVVIKHPF